MAFSTLRLSAPQLLADGRIRVPQLFQRWIDMNERTARVVDQIEEVTEVGAQLVDARRDGRAFLGDFGDATAGILIDDLDAVLCTHDVAAQLVRFFSPTVDRIADLMDENPGSIDVGGQVLDLRLQLVVALAVLSRIVGFEPGRLDQLHHMRLQRADRAGDILEPRVEVVDLLPSAVFVEGAGLRALLALLAKLLDGDPVLGGRALVVLEELLFATLTTEHLAHGLTKLVHLVLQSRQARFVPPPLVVLTQRSWTRGRLCIAPQATHRAVSPFRRRRA